MHILYYVYIHKPAQTLQHQNINQIFLDKIKIIFVGYLYIIILYLYFQIVTLK